MPRRLGVVAGCCLLVALVPGCTLLDRGPDAADVAGTLAAALEDHGLAEVPLTSEAPREQVATLLEPLDDRPVAVRVEGVDEGDGTARATLAWRWRLSEAVTWSYRTRARLVDDGDRWEVEWTPDTLAPGLAEGDSLGVRTLVPQRGDITGDGGATLVTERPVLRYGLDKTQVGAGQVRASARRIAQALDLSRGPYVALAVGAGPRAFVEAIVLRAEDARQQVPPSYADIPGAVAIEDTLALAPTRTFAAEILGRVGPATAEVVADSDGAVSAGDVVGLSGLQARYDDRLRGKAGLQVLARGRDDEVRPLFTSRPKDGRTLATSLDPDLQERAEQALAGLGERGPRSAIVALRPSDGAVLVAANGPANGGLNAATTGQYAPGSTFKVVTSLALLRAGLTPQTVLPCPATTVVDGRTFTNYSDFPATSVGRITLAQALAQSCNTAFIGARDRLGEGDLSEAAEALGIGRDRDVGYPSWFGQVPEPATETERAADTIGQGTVLAGPLAMATVAASVVAGEAVVPRLLPDVEVAGDGPVTPLTRAEARALRTMMRGVVTTGSGRLLADLPGDVGAKTGTAEFGRPDRSGELRTHAWMIGFRGDLAVAVFVEEGESGSQTAGPLLRQMLS